MRIFADRLVQSAILGLEQCVEQRSDYGAFRNDENARSQQQDEQDRYHPQLSVFSYEFEEFAKN